MYVELKNAYKTYGSNESKVNALNNANLGINEGEICVILGPSGSGKSTLLNILGGIDTLTSGTLVVDNLTISSLKSSGLLNYRRKFIGFIFQFYNLIEDLTVGENIKAISEISQNPMNIDDILKSMGIEHLKNRFPKELSGGQQQRAAIARALVKNPKILLCDELTGALDSKSSKEVLKLIQRVNNEFKTTVLIITHNELIKNIANRIIRIKDGEIIENKINPNIMDAERIEF